MSKELFFIFLISFAVFSNSCKKDKPENNNPSESSSLIISENEAFPYQFINIQLPNGTQPAEVEANIIEVKIGDSVVYGARLSSPESALNTNTYQLLIPEMNQGKYKVSIKTNTATQLEADLNIKALPEIGNIETYINNYITSIKNAESSILITYDEMVKSGSVSQGAADSMKQFVQAWHAKIPTYTDGLTEESKRVFAYLVEVNKPLLTKYKENAAKYNFTSGKKDIYDDCLPLYREYREYERNMATQDWATLAWNKYVECQEYNDAARTTNLNTYTSALKNAWSAAESAYHAGKRGDGYLWGVECFVKTYFSATADDIAKQRQTKLEKYGSFGVKSIHDVKQKSAPSFKEDEETYLHVGVDFLNFSRENAALFPELNKHVQSIDTYNETLNQFSDFLPEPVAPVSFPASKTEQKYTAGYTIDNISDSRISVSLIPAEEGLKVKFTKIGGITQPKTNFSFRVNVSTAFGSASKVIDAEITQTLDKVLINGSPWKVIYMVNDGEDFFKFQARGNYFCNNKEYFDSSKLLSAAMSFTTGNSGTFSGIREDKSPKFSGSGSNCYYLGTESKTEPETTAIGWTFDNVTNVIKIPAFVNDDVDEFNVTYANGIITLKGLYMEMRLQKP